MTTTPSARARQAAADLLRRHYPHEKGTERLAQAIEAGRADSILFVQAFARFEAAIRADQMKRDAGVAASDVDWTTFSKRDIEQWDGGPDTGRDYRLGIRVGSVIATAIRQKGSDHAG